MKPETDVLIPGLSTQDKGMSRRNFLTASGLVGIGLFTASSLLACKNDGPGVSPDGTIDLGSDDTGILNYAYALEQLEAAFYTRVAGGFFSGATAAEQALLADIRDHEIAHREFFKNALGSKAIPALEVDFSKIDFTSRDSVLGTAKAFEDLGVSAYNGAGKLIASKEYLLLAGKIVSVEARHAALIRDLISNGSFANSEVVNPMGLDLSREPSEVLAIAGSFLKSKLSGKNLPTS